MNQRSFRDMKDQGCFALKEEKSEGISGQRERELEGLSGQTKGQPFQKGVTAKSLHFRIPAMVTLSDGRLVAAADARWLQPMDACGIDIVVSYSDDNGETWNYDTPIYFNDTVNGGDFSFMQYGTTTIDSALLKDEKDVLYLLVDIYPGGVAINTAPFRPAKASGYITMGDGKKRLVLYLGNSPEEQTIDNWSYFVGDFCEDSFAPVFEKADFSMKEAKYYIDRGYYLYDEEKEPLYCRRLGEDESFVKQNVFFFRAALHVRCATYLVLFRSVDRGETWSKPTILNPQLLEDETETIFLGCGPGTGLSLKDGSLVFSVYKFNASTESQRASFIYSEDGKTWKHTEDAGGKEADWSSESVPILIDENRIRLFVRHGAEDFNNGKVRYIDYIKENGEWKAGAFREISEADLHTDCQLSALRLEGTLEGKNVILISAPGTGERRTNGKIMVFTLEENLEMRLINIYSIKNRYPEVKKFAYSCLAQQKDGRIALLSEDNENPEEIGYYRYDFKELSGGRELA